MAWLDYAAELVGIMRGDALRIEEMTPELVARTAAQLNPLTCHPHARYGLTEQEAFAGRPHAEVVRLRAEANAITRLAYGADAEQDDDGF